MHCSEASHTPPPPLPSTASAEIIQRGGLPAVVEVANADHMTDKQNACRALFSMAIGTTKITMHSRARMLLTFLCADFTDDLVKAGAVASLKRALQVQSPVSAASDTSLPRR